MNATWVARAVVGVVLVAAGCTIDTRVATLRDPDAGGPADAGGPRFSTLRAGAALPDEAACAALVRAAPEQRPKNSAPNHRPTTAAEVARLESWSLQGYDDRALPLEARITGAFSGTTDEVLQWVACKWGFDEDLVRAEAVERSNWNQSVVTDWTTTLADCPADADTRTLNGPLECAQTYGLMQVLWKYHQSAWPMYRDSTPFHLDYVYALRRACFEGLDTSQGARVANPEVPYVAGDEWGCMGAHVSGVWYDDGANTYIEHVRSRLAEHKWTRTDF